MFEQMDIAEYIYEVLVEPSYEKSTREDTNRYGYIREKLG